MLIAGMVFGITGVVYAQVGAAGTAGGGVGAGIGAVGGGVAGQAGAGSEGIAGQAGPGSEGIAGQAGPGSEGIGQAGGMSNTSKALRGQEQDSSRSGRAVPGLGSSLEPRAGAAAGTGYPPWKEPHVDGRAQNERSWLNWRGIDQHWGRFV